MSDVIEALDDLGYPARQDEAVLVVENMNCGSCVGRVERALADLPGVLSANVNLATETATVRYAAGSLSVADLTQALGAAGYPAQSRTAMKPEARDTTRDAEAQDSLVRMRLAAVP